LVSFYKSRYVVTRSLAIAEEPGVQHAISVEILLTAAQLYKRSIWKGLQWINDLEDHSGLSEIAWFVSGPL